MGTTVDIDSLQTGVMATALYNMAFAVGVFLVVAMSALNVHKMGFERVARGVGEGFLALNTLLLVNCLVHFFFAIWLYMGARDKQMIKCGHWMYYSMGEDFLATLLFLFLLIWKKSSQTTTIGLAIGAFVQALQIWLVREFMEAVIKKQTEDALNVAVGVASYIGSFFWSGSGK